MAAGQGFKTFNTGDVLTSSDTNGYLMQGVWVFANAAARTAAVTSPQEGNMSFLKDTNSTEYYDGAAWAAIGGGGGSSFVGCKAYKSANQSISNATVTKISFDSEYFDTSAIHDTSTNNTRFTVPTGKAGKWQVSITVSYADNSTGQRQLRVVKNNTTYNNIVMVAVNGDETHLSHTDIFDLAVGDYMEVAAYQTSTGALDVTSGNYTTFSFFYLGA
jgi:hypothetical protein